MTDPHLPPDPAAGFSRRNFLKSFGVSALATATTGAQTLAAEVRAANAEMPQGPGPVPVTLKINGETRRFDLEPRVTLLDTLRYHAGLTGSKEGCDRATCGACTVLFDGDPVYACMILAVDAQGHDIVTIEALGTPEKLSPLQAAFVAADASQCGFCTPGFVMCAHALLEENPRPTEADIRKACSGNICRCGTQPHILHAVQQAAGLKPAPQPEIIRLHHEKLA